MADEYSDEEFAADDGDGAAYEAEFDAEEEEAEEDEHTQPRRQPVITTEEAENNEVVNALEDGGGGEGEYAEEEDDDAYQESFDVDGDGNSEREQGGQVLVTEKAEQEDEDDQYEDDDAADWGDDRGVTPMEPPTAEEEKEEQPEEQKYPVVTPPAGDNVAPEPPPLATLNVDISPVAPVSVSPSTAGRQRSSSLSQIAELPHIELCSDPEMQAKLTRRSSSPRTRPAPMRRLASLGEAGVATIESLLVPTNAVTEEAAAVVSAAAAMDASSTLLKRPSATFVPRLASLKELWTPPTEDAAVTREGARSRGSRAATPESCEDGEEQDDDEKEEDDAGDDGKVSGAEEQGDADVAEEEEEEEEEEERQGPEERDDERSSRGLDDERVTSDSLTAEDREVENMRDENVHAEDTTVDALEADGLNDLKSPPSSEDDFVLDVQLKVQNVGDDDAGIVEDSNVLEALRPDTNAFEAKARDEEEDASSTEAASPSQKPMDGAPQDLMERLMADVEYADDANAVENEGGDEDTAYAGDDTEFVVDAEDGDRRETRQLLHEAQMIITKQKEVERAGSPPDPTGYDDDDPFSDDDAGYGDDDEDADDTRPSAVQYDSDYEELGIEEDDADEPRDVKHLNTQPPELTIESQSKATSVGDEQRVDEPKEEKEPLEATPKAAEETVAAVPKIEAATPETKWSPKTKEAKQTPSSSRTTTTPAAAGARRSFRPVSVASKASSQETKPRSTSQGSPRKPVKPPDDPTPSSTPRKPEVPKFTPKAPAPRQPPAKTPPAMAPAAPLTIAPQEQPHDQKEKVVHFPQHSEPPRPVSPVKSNEAGIRASSPVRAAQQAAPKSPAAALPRKAPVFKQKKASRAASPDPKSKKLKPVKCPPNLRIDIASHMDREKREWLLLNMFRHGDDVTKYEAFIPTSAAHQHITEAIAGVDMAMGEARRPLSARQIYGEPPAQHASRGTYSRHGGRKLVDRPVDPRLKERESSWVSTKSCESSIPTYDSILDKYCKTVTSPVVQRRIYETREYDLSPQLALVLEKRAFKEWKHGETESGFGSVSKSYKTAVVPPSASAQSLHPTRPPPSSSSTSALASPSIVGSTVVFDPEAST